MTARLCGHRVVNTRATHQAAELDRLLIAHGAIPVPYPCIEIAPPDDLAPLTDALSKLESGAYDWLVLTSRNTVHALAKHGMKPPRNARALRIAAVGPSTAEAARDLLGLTAHVIPDIHSGAELASAMPVAEGDRVLIPASDLARSEIANVLMERGAIVDRVVAYRTTVGAGGSDLKYLLSDGQIDALTFCSSSAVEGFIARLAAEGGSIVAAHALPAVCIGEPTHATAVTNGFRHAAAATPHSLDGLISTLASALSAQPQGGTRWQ